MSNDETQRQETDAQSKTERRAEWEAFEYRVPAQGAVRIENKSYGDESSEHAYVVTVDNGHATACTCPANKYHSGLCKHRHAVERQPAVMIAASANDEERAVATDGGRVEEVR